MADNVSENVMMKGSMQYCIGGGRPDKMGEACLTADSLSIRKVNQTVQTVFMVAGVVLALVVVNATIGITGGSYIGAALKGSLTGAAGAILGVFVSRRFPQKAGEVDINVSRKDIVDVRDKSIGVRTAIEVHSENGVICVVMGLSKQEEWKRALLNNKQA